MQLLFVIPNVTVAAGHQISHRIQDGIDVIARDGRCPVWRKYFIYSALPSWVTLWTVCYRRQYFYFILSFKCRKLTEHSMCHPGGSFSLAIIHKFFELCCSSRASSTSQSRFTIAFFPDDPPWCLYIFLAFRQGLGVSVCFLYQLSVAALIDND